MMTNTYRPILYRKLNIIGVIHMPYDVKKQQLLMFSVHMHGDDRMDTGLPLPGGFVFRYVNINFTPARSSF